MQAVVTNGLGHESYLTHERWQHIVDEHHLFLCHRDHAGLPHGNATKVVVRIGVRPDGTANNFGLTAYQISRMKS